eukprot:scaffold47187_cov27-Prasinocladus_malaysianus.AAC.2
MDVAMPVITFVVIADGYFPAMMTTSSAVSSDICGQQPIMCLSPFCATLIKLHASEMMDPAGISYVLA